MWKTSIKTALLEDQGYFPQDPTLSHTRNSEKKNQHNGILHVRKNTLVPPQPSSINSYMTPQPKPTPQACAPLGDFCIYFGYDLWGGCTLT